jgi:hypothetical protein
MKNDSTYDFTLSGNQKNDDRKNIEKIYPDAVGVLVFAAVVIDPKQY